MTSFWRVPTIARRFIGQRSAGEILVNMLRSEDDGDFRSWRQSHGARCLADWLMRQPDRELALDVHVMTGALTPALLKRILTGEVDPGDAARQAISTATIGAITPEMFDQFDDDLPPAAAFAAPARSPAQPPDPGDDVGRLGGGAGRRETLSTVLRLSPLGHQPDPGPLVRVEPSGEGWFLQLPGIAVTLDRATAAGVHEALGRAIDARG